MSFANKLKILRTENRMTQQDVADHLNVARSTVDDACKSFPRYN